MDVFHLAALGQFAQVLGQTIDDLVPVVAHPGQVDPRRLEMNAQGVALPRVGDELGGVQQRLGGDAAHVQAGAAQLLGRVDQGDFHALVGRQEGRGVAARTAADDEQLAFRRFGHDMAPLGFSNASEYRLRPNRPAEPALPVRCRPACRPIWK